MTIEDFNSEETRDRLKGVFANVRKEGEKVQKTNKNPVSPNADITPKSFKNGKNTIKRESTAAPEKGPRPEISFFIEIPTKSGSKQFEVKKGQIFYMERNDARKYEILAILPKKKDIPLLVKVQALGTEQRPFFLSQQDFLKNFENNDIRFKVAPEEETQTILEQGITPPPKPQRGVRTRKTEKQVRPAPVKAKHPEPKEVLATAPEESWVSLNDRKFKEGETMEYDGKTYLLQKIEDIAGDKKLRFLIDDKDKVTIKFSQAQKLFNKPATEKRKGLKIASQISPKPQATTVDPLVLETPTPKKPPVYTLDTNTLKEAAADAKERTAHKEQYDKLAEKIAALEERAVKHKAEIEEFEKKRADLERFISTLENEQATRKTKREEREKRIAELETLLAETLEEISTAETKTVPPETGAPRKVQKFLTDFIKNNTPDFKKIFAGIENEKEKLAALRDYIVEGVSGFTVEKEFFKKALKYTLATGIMVVGNIERVSDGNPPTLEKKKPIETSTPAPKIEKPTATFNTKSESGVLRFAEIRDALERASAKDAERLVAEAAADPRIEIADRQAFASMPTNARIAYLINALKSPSQRTGFLIGCKENTTGYAFDHNNMLIHSFPAIFGKDTSENKNTTNSKKGKLTGATTPSDTYLFGKGGLRADQIKKYESRVFMIYGDQNGVMLHEVDSTEVSFDDRIKLLEEGGGFMSLGCMVYGKEDGNVLNQAYGDSNKKFKLYITPTDPKTVFVPKF